jgi:hypothetical protein
MVGLKTTFKYSILNTHNSVFPLQYGVIISDILSKSVPSHCSYNNYTGIIELYFSSGETHTTINQTSGR